MIGETVYSKGNNHFKRNMFEGSEWSAPYIADADEIKEHIGGFNLVGRKIRDLRFIGLCYNLERIWIEEAAYNNATGTREEKLRQSDYKNIAGDLQFIRFAEIDEPLLLKVETEKTDADGDPVYDIATLEIYADQQLYFRMSMNSIPWWIDAGTNKPNMEASVLFEPCMGKTISDIEVITYRTKEDPMTSRKFPDESEKELVKSVILRLDDGTGIQIEDTLEYCIMRCIDSENKDIMISFDELKKGLFNWEDLHIDEISGVESYNSTLFFGRIGAEHCEEPFMTLAPSNSESRLHIAVKDFDLLAWCIGDLFECFDEFENYDYTYSQWASILNEAEKLLSFTSFDELFDYRVSLDVPSQDRYGGNYLLNEMNCQGKEFWMDREQFRKQLEDIREWTSIVLGENNSISIIGF